MRLLVMHCIPNIALGIIFVSLLASSDDTDEKPIRRPRRRGPSKEVQERNRKIREIIRQYEHLPNTEIAEIAQEVLGDRTITAETIRNAYRDRRTHRQEGD